MPKTILIAATDSNIIYLLQRYAEASGFLTVCASQEVDLLQQVRRLHPDLIILEIDLPEVNGKRVLRQLKADPISGEIPVVVYTYYDEVFFTPADGAAGYLQKSVLYDDFRAALQQTGVRA